MHTAFSIISSLTNKCHVRCGYRLINQNFGWILTSVFNDYALSGKTHLENWKLLSTRLLLTKNTFLPHIFFQYEQYFFGNFAISCCSSSWDVAIFFWKFFLSCCSSSLNIAFFWVNFSLLAVRLVWILQYCQFPNLISLLYSSANSQMKLKLINIWNPNIWNPQMNLSTVELYFEMQRLQVCKARTRLQEIIGIDFYD